MLGYKIICSHKLSEGYANLEMYGLRTAASAGFPEPTIDRALTIREHFKNLCVENIDVRCYRSDLEFRVDYNLVQRLKLLKDADLDSEQVRSRLEALKSSVEKSLVELSSRTSSST